MIKKLLLLVCLFLAIVANSQSVYNFETENSAYSNLTGSTSLNNGVVWDDPGYTIPLGFSFNFGTYTFSTIYILEWSIGGILSSDPVDGNIVPLFVPIGQDLVDFGIDSGVSQSNISYKTEGVSGSRILKVEWNNAGFYFDTTESDFMNFQLWLYEGSDTVEFRYGSSSISNPTGSFEGETGPQVSLSTSYNVALEQLEDTTYFLSENPANPTVITVNPDDTLLELYHFEGMIPNGTVYRFLRQPLSIPDIDGLRFSIYPNPTSSELNFKSNVDQYQMTIINNLGQLVKKVSNVASSLDVSDLQSGIYFLQFETSVGRVVQKFIKQ